MVEKYVQNHISFHTDLKIPPEQLLAQYLGQASSSLAFAPDESEKVEGISTTDELEPEVVKVETIDDPVEVVQTDSPTMVMSSTTGLMG